ncbi:hypothetical protein [Thioalkalivibrio sp. ALJ1]|uniref:hypothetical protein n=1 Tax=Thioalkalivibrio sp. ALJ1 TaxID=1158144 RepID=UPI000A7E9812|nr:hypothetical protein [Thioalkalivibrio sp. ALJ1]
MNPLTADAEHLPLNARLQVLGRRSASGWRVTLQGEVKYLGSGEHGLELNRIVLD